MRPALSITLLSLALLAGSASAADPLSETCCACVPGHTDTMGVSKGPARMQALFCALITSPTEQTAFDSKCDGLNGGGVCQASPTATEARRDNLDCDLLLAEVGIDCPAARPAPLLGHPLLGGLGALLAGLGMWAARRRMTRTRG